MKRSFSLVPVVCVLMLTGSLPAHAAVHHGPFLALGSETTMTVVWTTSLPQPGTVLYGKTPALGVPAQDTALAKVHQITLRQLQPDTRYYYRVVAGHNTSAVGTFVTAPRQGSHFSFAVYGDTRTNHADHIAVLNRMAEYQPRFVINTGDLVGSNTEKNWDAFFYDLSVATPVGRNAPYYSCPGNHESGEMYYEGVVLPTNNDRHTEEYYSFDYADVHVIALNSEIDYGPGSDQQRWLAEDLASPAARRAKFRVAYWHRPPYSTSIHGSDLGIRSALCPVMEANNVDLVFNGHDHVYERTASMHGTTYIIAGGGGAPLYDFRADSAWVAYKEKATHFCLLSVQGETLSMKMIRASDGTVGDSLLIMGRTPAERQPAKAAPTPASQEGCGCGEGETSDDAPGAIKP